ncbi:UPF0070 protein YfgM [Buchnera aphidicola (Cinara kochiana kochiana)]|uniref:UPF0070 protein YfgM n=1 Tax=Buchnera aphidicola (Cinara kochiana kochiana) TaxID=2518976 RepID=A0A451D646_9GAMM|nr:tetratricopeptide repeat protein [Buchnera aphidicola]VFP81298.1 UPF0070 protein YfgM [Buchnera aphidicola (Cinara kochiana kochiana)]
MTNNILAKFKTYFQKNIYITLLLILLSLSGCVILIARNYTTSNVTVTEFNRIIDNFAYRAKNTIKNKIGFLNKKNNIYTTLIQMNLSKHFFLKKEYKKSILMLRKLISLKLEENLMFLIKLNLVKLYIQQRQFYNAIEIVNNVRNHTWRKIFSKYRLNILLKREIF